MKKHKDKKELAHAPKFQPKFHRWGLGTINIRTGENPEGNKMYAVAKEACRANLTICALQEVRWTGSGAQVIIAFQIGFWCIWCI